MRTAIFDTLEFAKKLKAADFTDQQAETLATAVSEIIEARLATKEDIAMLQRDIAMLQRDIRETELRLKHDLTLRLGGMLAGGIAVVAALVKLL
ncbi:hypothetical protein [Desulfobacca acetoxidans]|uniref:DUF1640 domain-containing protein n=1 Tax=Desulfobacca acetoxidans (strain ATCC 700848 / DSM 11109 / ASRB2) TaxID=880072 RepID=F2NJU5_DESAR|nr:hypothetical protein [Desulfobacca acetoxidans]AEB09750.1 hypothetical protein Desac_1912 [Desulfobacca acetoxidans DSM 11109]